MNDDNTCPECGENMDQQMRDHIALELFVRWMTRDDAAGALTVATSCFHDANEFMRVRHRMHDKDTEPESLLRKLMDKAARR